MDKIKLLIKYIVYIFRRNGARGHGIHSPYVFELNRNVLNSRIKYSEYKDIFKFSRTLQERKDKIEVQDHGADSRVFSTSARRVADIAKYAGSSVRTGRLLFRLARYMKPGILVELGTSLGFGTYCLARGAESGIVYSLEGCPVQHKLAAAELERFGISNTVLIRGLFSDNLPGLLNRIDRVDMVYFDGDHKMESLIWQFNQCLPWASQDTVFVIGDINWSEGMNEAWKIICNDPAVRISVDMFFCGLVFFRRGIAKQHFILGYSG